MFKLSVLMVSVLFGLVSCDKDKFCDPSLCRSGNQHIACGHSGDFHEACPEDRHIVDLSKKEIELILDTHNNVRNKIANGDEPGFNPAERMATMVSHLLVLAQKIAL